MSIKLSTTNLDNELVLAKFANGRLVDKKALKNIKLYSHSNEKLKRKILVTETDRLQYAGYNYGVNSLRQTKDSKQYIGVLDKTTNKMHVMSYTVFNMKPTLLGNEVDGFTVEVGLKPDDSAARQQQSMKQEQMLTMSFGSLKKQRTLEMKHRLQVEVDEISATMKTAVDNMPSISTSDDNDIDKKEWNGMDTSDPMGEILPPINRDAKTVDAVYNINDIASDEDLFHLYALSKVMADATETELTNWKQNKTYPQFVLKKLESLPTEPNDRLNKCKILCYYTHLVSLLDIKRGKVQQKNPILKVLPEAIRRKFVENFFLQNTNEGGKGMVLHMIDKMKDKVMAHVIVLAMLFDGFATEAKLLQEDLKIASKRFQLLVHICGAGIRKVKRQGVSISYVTFEFPMPEREKKIFPRKKK